MFKIRFLTTKKICALVTAKISTIVISLLTVTLAYSDNISDCDVVSSENIISSQRMRTSSQNCSRFNDWKRMNHARKPFTNPGRNSGSQSNENRRFRALERELRSLSFPPPRINKSDCCKPRINRDEFIMLIEDNVSAIFDYLIPPASAYPLPDYGGITIDGDLDDWSLVHRLNVPNDLPPNLMTENILYGTYVDSEDPVYVIALKTAGEMIGHNTTFWLNTDNDSLTGYQIWGSYGGAEYFVNIYSDTVPHLYTEDFNWVPVELDYAYNQDGTVLELAIPANLIDPIISPQAIGLMGDINNTTFLFPSDFFDGVQYEISKNMFLPSRTNFGKRVGIVYSETSRDLFFSDKAYSQLNMSLQHQSMMAGIPFDLLSENDLTDISTIVNYDVLVFPFFMYLPDEIRESIYDTLYKAVYHYNIGLITADNFLTNDQNGSALTGDPYKHMKQLLGINRIGGSGPVNMSVSAGSVNHRLLDDYFQGENIISYTGNWYSYYQGLPDQPFDTIAEQSVSHADDSLTVHPALIATQTGGRNVHFSDVSLIGDTNLAWQAIQWAVYGDDPGAGLKLSRNNSIFISRNDMDLSMEYFSVPEVHYPLLDIISNWKQQYNFVGSYYINIGNSPSEGYWTDWTVSTPLFTEYMNLGNEIGTHSWTHPYFTDLLDDVQLEFEFNQSMDEILVNLGRTWRNNLVRGAAVPGAPETRETADEIIQYLDYLTGGYSGRGAGYPGAFGYLHPSSTKVYFSPNIKFDFTLIEYGVPMGNPPVPVPLSAEEAEQYWLNELETVLSHASTPIIHWPWHDYAATVEADPVYGSGYTLDMFSNFIAAAYNANTEFATLADVNERISNFVNADISTQFDSGINQMVVSVLSVNAGKYALELDLEAGQYITNIQNWYAYNDNKVYIDNDGGSFVIQLGNTIDQVTRITELPMRSNLMSISGDGDNLSFTLEGEGEIKVELNSYYPEYHINVDSENIVSIGSQEIIINLPDYDVHTISIAKQ